MADKQSKTEYRHATMADVAKLVGVSRPLVSIAFRGEAGVSKETAEKIFAAAKEIGYSPNLAAQSLRREGSKYIGVAYHTSHSSSEELLPAIYQEAEAHGFKVVLSAISNYRDDQKAIDEIIGHRCDGAILISSNLPVERLKKLVKRLPIVSVGRRIEGVKCGVVASKGESGIFDAVEYLVGLGHKSIAYVDTKEMFDHEFRLSGYETAMKKAKLKTLVISIDGDSIESAGAQAAEKLMAAKQLPTAIVCANDQVALGLIYSFQKVGIRVPQDVSVVGYDDTIARLPFLDFTTVHQDAQELAKAAVDDLAARINGEKTKAETILTSSKLVVRSSTTKPRNT